MPRSYDMAAEYGCGVAQVHGAFADEAYWLERLAKSGCDVATLDALTIGDDGGLSIATTQTVGFHRLPGFVTQLHSGDLTLVRTETWTPVRDGRATGTIKGVVPGAPVSVTGTAEMSSIETGARVDVHATVQVRIPLLGGKVEGFIGGQLAEMVRLEEQFTSQWITEHV
ncbi:hypothetical protein ASE48_15110 [Mycobacterium sp. Root265]|uniref:DUF2505 domain-containing protein n=1 Tax=Mycobacterium sp. Root265 TaxID=1736504 RepID=UPI00070EDDA7|nr:DUF2505 domain-containing protein [Mycobacterium sp. Root265]KRD06065.1 hypothetical protein ASE48_15110 [Mycobacterium sp. Root265]